jgi:multidrug resistance protein, MATE family
MPNAQSAIIDRPAQPQTGSRTPGWRCLVPVLRLGGPIVIAQLAQMANGFVDTLMAGNASALDLAAVGLGVSIWVPLSLFLVGLLGALQPLIAERRGANDSDSIVRLFGQGAWLAMLGAGGMMLAIAFANPLIALFKPDAATAEAVSGYLYGFNLGVPALVFMLLLRGLTDGLGHTRAFMAFCLLSTLCNIPLNALLIYGLGPFPALGATGCGYATALSNTLAAMAYGAYVATSPAYSNWRAEWLRAHGAWRPSSLAWTIAKLGIPIGIALFVEVSMFCAVALFLAPLGATAVAAHQMVLNASSILFMVPLSLGMAVMLRISYLRGQGDAAGAKQVACWAFALALAIAAFNAPLLYWGRHLWASIYTQDSAVIALAITLFPLAALFQIVDVLQVTAINALRGYQDTRWPMVIIVFAFWGLCLPLGYALAFGTIPFSATTLAAMPFATEFTLEPLGARGFWWGLTAGLAAAAILMVSRLAWRLRNPESNQLAKPKRA